jgi:hypothetical protein
MGMSEEVGGRHPAKKSGGMRRMRRHEAIAMASQDFLDRPDQISTITRSLFHRLTVDAIPVLQGATSKQVDVDAWFARSPVEKRLVIARGQQQALRSALTHLVFMQLAAGILPLLERNETLALPPEERCSGDAYICDVIKMPYLGVYHQFMLAGARWIQQPALRFIESLRSPGHRYHQLFAATYESQAVVRKYRIEQQKNKPHRADRGIIRDSEDFQAYQPLFIANFQDVMIALVAAQKAYRAQVNKKDDNRPRPEAIARFALANLDTLFLPAYMKRETALRKMSHPAIRYANQPMKEKPFADMPPIFSVVGDLPQLKLDLAPEFAYLKSVSHSFCAGIVTHRSRSRRGQEIAERLLSVAGVPSGRSPESPNYGRVDPVTVLGIIGVRIAKDTIFRERPF